LYPISPNKAYFRLGNTGKIENSCSTQSRNSMSREKSRPSGLEKSLGFSKFAFIYDCQEERIRTARIEFSASDGFKRDTIIGVWNYLNEEKDWLEIKIHFSLAEYDTFLDELRRYAASRTSTDQHFLLYSISAEAGAISNSGRNINLIYSISNRGVYPERNAHKIHVMSKLDEGRSNPDLRYRHLCEDKMQNFFKLIEDKN